MERDVIKGIPADVVIRSIQLTNDGVDRVVNGTFTGSATGWTLATGWAYSANTVLKNAAGTGALEQAIGAQAKEIYKLVFTISAWTAGTTLTPSIGGVNGTAISGNGTYTQYITTTSTANLKFTPTTDVRCTIDGVSVVKMDCFVCVDSSGNVKGAFRGDGVLSISNAVAVSAGTASTHKVTIDIGGTTYYLLVTNV